MQYGEIKLKNGQTTLISESDIPQFGSRKWCLTQKGYVMCRDGYLHRLIMNAPKGVQVDHIDGNKLNNQRDNLRLANNSQNHANIGLLGSNKSGFKGVWYAKRNKNKWVANIWCNNIKYHLGCFATRIEAAIAYDRKAIKLFGKYAHLNMIGGQNG